MRVAGRLDEAAVADLLQVCAETPQPIVELDDLRSADVAGLDALVRIEERGAHLMELPEYLRMTIDTLKRERRG